MLPQYADLANRNPLVLQKYRLARRYYSDNPSELEWFVPRTSENDALSKLEINVEFQRWTLVGWWLGLHYMLFQRPSPS